MTKTKDIDIDALLRSAEQRLETSSQFPAAPATSAPHAVTKESASEQASQPKEKLSVRQAQKKISQAPTKDTAGNDWFDLPKTDLTPEMKRDWQILRMRNVLNPSQQMKSLHAKPPTYSQVGEIIAGPTDFFSGRLNKKERKQSLFAEAMSESHRDKLQSKYAGIQKTKASGKKGFYKKLVQQRRNRQN